MQEQLARIYEKRLGSKSSMRPITGVDVMSIPIDLLLRSTRGANDIAKKRQRRYEDSIMDRYLDDVEANDGSWAGMDAFANNAQGALVGFWGQPLFLWIQALINLCLCPPIEW
jgi:hypothetical protein